MWNQWPPDHQSDVHPTEPQRPIVNRFNTQTLCKLPNKFVVDNIPIFFFIIFISCEALFSLKNSKENEMPAYFSEKL